eukprot:TRINITY_DN1515_c0_g1_i2.p1 TRINITY_DN1515_c0_g1~~TRINITY_DN1515_c0_g1_i2.p1  ORF type:complete len:536 (-),score=127.68 TRINITY_DN1515_c0_g1_i2:255-1862(-)
MKPPERIANRNNVVNLLTRSGGVCQKTLETFRLKINPNPKTTAKKSLPYPELIGPGFSYRYTDESYTGMNTSFNKEIRTKLNLNAPKMNAYNVLITCDDNSPGFLDWVTEKFYKPNVSEFVKAANIGLDMKIKCVVINESHNYRHAQFLKSNPNILANIKFWVVVLSSPQPDMNTTNYQEVKQFSVEHGIHVQAINCQKGKLFKGKKPLDEQYNLNSRIAENIYQNIALQIIEKPGVFVWWAPIVQYAPALAGKKVCIIGYDVHHSKKKYDKESGAYAQKKSTAAYVAAIVDEKRDKGRWSTFCGAHSMQARDEILGKPSKERGIIPDVDYIPEQLETVENPPHALSKFVGEIMKKHPDLDMLLVYRDGVSNDELVDVVNYEISDIKKNFPRLQIVWSVVQKRNPVKFYIKEGDKYHNPPPGTVFEEAAKNIVNIRTDGVVRNVILSEFYLIPTFNGTSTCKPVHYTVLEGDSRTLPTDQLQKLTFVLCHLYPNWFSTIRVPFVIQAAHKLAELLGETCGDTRIHQNLKESFFYL